MDTPRDILRTHWGYDSFRPMQEEIIASVLDGRDTLGLLPTGGGKSLTFQVPALMLPGITLVVTPLISLMKDQVDNLAERGIRAVMFHAGLTRRERELALTRCRLGGARIIYLSPERLANEQFVAELRTLTVSLLVVDEAHCISQWGYDFRPSYLRIARLRTVIGEQVPVLALTASATPAVADDIMRSLRFRGRHIFARSFARPGISYIVRHTDTKDPMLLRVLRGTSGCAIVYVRSRRRTRLLADMLVSEGISAEAYHAGLAPEDKTARQNRWKAGHTRVMVATNAFGMGIDKPDVRTVIHYDLPSSLEEYYQEAGRGGRDGRHAYAVSLVSRRDRATLTRRISESFPERDYIARVYELACNFLDIPVGSGYGRVYEFDFEKFCRTFSLRPVPTESALQILTRSGYLEYTPEVTTDSRLMVIMDRDELYNLDLDDTTERVFRQVLRRYTGLFADYVPVSEVTLSMELMLPTTTVYESLLYLSRLHAIHYIPRRTTPYLYLPTSREEPRHLIIPIEVYDHRRRQMEQRIEAVKRFMFDDTECRATTLLRYFGEPAEAPCGTCDVCRERRRATTPPSGDGEIITMDHTILYRASRPGGTTLADLADLFPGRQADLAAAIRTLIDRGTLTLTGTRLTTT